MPPSCACASGPSKLRLAVSRDPGVPDESEVAAEIARVLREDLGLSREVKPGDDLVTDLQLDSVALLPLVVGLEDRFRVALLEEDAARVRTVADLAALVVHRAEEN